jgi:hypothetical protein
MPKTHTSRVITAKFLLTMEQLKNGRAQLIEIRHAYFIVRIKKNEKIIKEKYQKLVPPE